MSEHESLRNFPTRKPKHFKLYIQHEIIFQFSTVVFYLKLPAKLNFFYSKNKKLSFSLEKKAKNDKKTWTCCTRKLILSLKIDKNCNENHAFVIDFEFENKFFSSPGTFFVYFCFKFTMKLFCLKTQRRRCLLNTVLKTKLLKNWNLNLKFNSLWVCFAFVKSWTYLKDFQYLKQQFVCVIN